MRKSIFLILLVFIPIAAGAEQTADDGDSIALGPKFESRVAGIELQPPAGGTLVRQIESGDLVRFVYPEKSWDLKVRLVHLGKPVPLSFVPTAQLSGGLLEMTVADLKMKDPSAEVLMQDVREYPPYKVGMIAARCNSGADRGLVQEAIFKSDDQNFYTLLLTTPGRRKDDKSPDDDPKEVLAARTFEKVLATVKLIDRSQLKTEQDERLLHTRALFMMWDEKKLRSVLVPKRFLRVVREGKDVGYVQVDEQVATHAGNDGIEVDLLSHSVIEAEAPVAAAPTTEPATPTGLVMPVPVDPLKAPLVPTGPIKTDRETKMFVTFDRWHEDWSIVTNFDNGMVAPTANSELGNSDLQVERVLDREKAANMWKDTAKHDQPPVIEKQKYSLSVSQYTRTQASAPVERQLPVFYLQQALGHFLPRLVPLDTPQGYMFASYVSSQREVMARYVDVMTEQEVELDGQKVLAIPVRDRIGVEGAGTTHYLTRDGKWLGSITDDQKVAVLPTDAAGIKRIWKDAKVADAP